MYVHVYPIQEIQGILFGLGHSSAALLQAALKREVALPARRPATMEDLAAHCPELIFLRNATERTIRWPGTSPSNKRTIAA